MDGDGTHALWHRQARTREGSSNRRRARRRSRLRSRLNPRLNLRPPPLREKAPPRKSRHKTPPTDGVQLKTRWDDIAVLPRRYILKGPPS